MLRPVVLALVLIGCSNANPTANNGAIVSEAPLSGSAPATQLSAGGVVVIPSATASAQSSVDPNVVRGLIAIPKDAACELTEESFTKVPPLLLTVDGAPFATVGRFENARVFVQADPVKTGLVLRGDVGSVELTALGNVSDLTVFATKVLPFADVFAPFGNTELRILDANSKGIRLRIATAPIELTELTTPLEIETTCDAAALRLGKVKPRAAAGTLFKSGVLVGQSIPLASAATGEPVTKLVPTTADGSRAVDVFEQGAARTRIGWSLRSGYVSGWVPKAAVKPAQPAEGDKGSGTGGSTLGPMRNPPRESRTCDRDVSLGASVNGDSAIVGRIKSGAILDLYQDDGERVTLHVRDADIRTSKGARLFVAKADIERCAIASPPP